MLTNLGAINQHVDQLLIIELIVTKFKLVDDLLISMLISIFWEEIQHVDQLLIST